MEEIKIEFDQKNLDNLRNFADNWMLWTDDMTENEELQSVPEADPTMPFLNQHSNYPMLQATPGWMDYSQNFSNLDSATGEIHGSTYVDEPSPTPSSTGSFAFTDYAESYVAVDGKQERLFKNLIDRLGVDEKTLQDFSVKDLNRWLKSKGLSKDEQRCLKNRRRTLKNRGYAQNCRIKRIRVKKDLEAENESLKKELDQLRASVARATKERDVYKAKLQEIAKFLKLQRSGKVA